METLSPSVVLAAYAESLVDGRRVAVFGEASLALAEELVERGSRLVHLYDPDPARAAEAAARNRSKQVSVLSLDAADIAVRDGAFDIALIPDLGSLEEHDKLLKRVRRALAPRGAAIVATPNPDAKITLTNSGFGRRSDLTYYDLFDAVSAEFPEVRMLGQTPFVGYAVVDFAPEGEPEVGLDSGLVPGGTEEPEWFIAVASAAPVELEMFGIVQLPMSGITRPVDSTLERHAEELEEVLVARDRTIVDLEARALTAEAKAQIAERELKSLREDAAKASAKPVAAPSRDAIEKERAAERQLTEQRLAAAHAAELAKLEQRLRADHAAEKTELERKVKELGADKDRLEKEQATVREAEKQKVEKRLAELTDAKTALERRVADREKDIERLAAATAGDSPEDVSRLEESLKARAEHVRKLEADLRESERVGKELVRELETVRVEGKGGARQTPPSPALSSENARLRADLEAAGWTIQELEGRLSGSA